MNKDEVKSTKFLGMNIDNHMNWKNHVEQIVPKLSAACFSRRSLIHTLNPDILCMVYFAYFHSVLQYRIIFWGNSIMCIKYLNYKKERLE